MSMHQIVRRTLMVTATLAAVVVVATPASAQARKARGHNHVTKPRARGAAVRADSVRGAEAYLHAMRLADYGRQSRSALALASAAQIMMDLGVGPLGVEARRPAGAAPQAKSHGAASFAPESLLAEARGFAEGNASAIALIDQLSARASGGSKGAVGGPKENVDRVLSHSTDTYRLSFRGDEEAYVTVRGDGDTDLDCYVYDEYDNLIVKDDDHTDFCILRWNPRWTGPFTIKIRNLGDVYNQYRIVTN